jgi:hypothetical protein
MFSESTSQKPNTKYQEGTKDKKNFHKNNLILRTYVALKCITVLLKQHPFNKNKRYELAQEATTWFGSLILLC